MKALIVRFGKVGDLLVSYPPMLTLYKGMPDLEITLCVDNKYSQAAHIFSGVVDRVLCFDLHYLPASALVALPALSDNYDLLMDLQADAKSCEIAKLVKACRKIGFDTPNTDNSAYTETVVPTSGESISDSYYSVFKRAFTSLPDAYDKIPIKRPTGVLNTVAIAPGGSAACKRWSIQKWELLMQFIRREYHDCRILLISQDKENTLAGIYHDEWINQCTLSKLQARLSEVDLLISNESGLMHLGAITGCRVIGLFGFGNVAIWSSYSDCILPIRNAYKCKKQEKENCELLCLQPDCLETIDPKQVMNAIRSCFPVSAHA
jgi:ADP-heptose:LPS heptosyltransferase